MPSPYDIENWEEFLKENGCRQIIDYGEWIMCRCPFHDQSDETRPSFGIYKENGNGNCFGCGKHNWENICELFNISSIDFIDAVREAKWSRFIDKLKGKGKRAFKRFKLPENCISPQSYQLSRIYLAKRGISKETQEQLGIRVCVNKDSKYMDSLIFPIYDERGLLFFDSRYIGSLSWKPRWSSPKDSPKWRAYFNWNYEKRYQYLILVEGASDAAKMYELGFKDTIPAKYFSDTQLSMIFRSGADDIFLAYDMDEAGRFKVDKYGNEISFQAKAKILLSNASINIHTVHFPKGVSDPGELRNMDKLLNINPKLKAVFENN